MKLKDLLCPLSTGIYVHVYNSAGNPIAYGRVENFQWYIRKVKRENSRKRLKRMYYAKVVDIWFDNLNYDYRSLGVQIDYEE